MKRMSVVSSILSFFVAGAVALGQDSSNDKFVSKEEHEQLKQQHEKLQQELETLKAQMQQILARGVTQPNPVQSRQDPEKDQLKQEVQQLKTKVQQLEEQGKSHQTELDEAIDKFQKSYETLEEKTEPGIPGTTNFLITGYSFASFTDREGENSTFSAGFNPIFL